MLFTTKDAMDTEDIGLRFGVVLNGFSREGSRARNRRAFKVKAQCALPHQLASQSAAREVAEEARATAGRGHTAKC